MARELVDDGLWAIVRPLLAPPPAHKTPAGRKRLDERRVFTGILFILQSGLPWELLPKAELALVCDRIFAFAI
jgi:transposase